ncbi:hypothetical protein [Streptomyces griseorubiginosus]|uniref:hypothetical protein n=1 Tax=Streptomyces griseorubiginosus TaxID=67304 RepID=UPI00364DD10B
MGTSLTPEFWERFVLLLFAAMGATIVLTAFFDALALRIARRRAQTPPAPPAAQARPRLAARNHRTPVSR